jgi:ribonuclease P protein component
VVNKKFGNAVKRNKIKRQLKEIFRSIKEGAIDNMDFIIIVKNAMGDLEFSEIKEAVMSNINKFIH